MKSINDKLTTLFAVRKVRSENTYGCKCDACGDERLIILLAQELLRTRKALEEIGTRQTLTVLRAVATASETLTESDKALKEIL